MEKIKNNKSIKKCVVVEDHNYAMPPGSTLIVMVTGWLVEDMVFIKLAMGDKRWGWIDDEKHLPKHRLTF